MTPTQCRMARAALDLSVRDLAALAQVAVNTVVRFEAGQLPSRPQTSAALRAVLEARRCTFLDQGTAGEEGEGVWMAKATRI